MNYLIDLIFCYCYYYLLIHLLILVIYNINSEFNLISIQHCMELDIIKVLKVFVMEIVEYYHKMVIMDFMLVGLEIKDFKLVIKMENSYLVIRENFRLLIFFHLPY